MTELHPADQNGEVPLSGLGIKRELADRAKKVWLHIEFDGVPCAHIAIPVAVARRLIVEGQ